MHDRLAALVVELRPAIAAEAVRWRPDQEPDVTVAQWEAALQRISDSLAANVQRLRELSDPEMPAGTAPAALSVGRPAAGTAAAAGYPDRSGGA